MKMSFVVEIEIDREDEGFTEAFAEYLTSVEHPFLGDYGPDAWGGYEGPKVQKIQVSKHGIIKGLWESEGRNY